MSLGEAIFWIIIFLYAVGMTALIWWYDNRTAPHRGKFRLIYVLMLNPGEMPNRYQAFRYGPKSQRYTDLPPLPAEWDIKEEDVIPCKGWYPLSKNDRLFKKIFRLIRSPRRGFIIFRDGANAVVSHYNCYDSEYNKLTPDYLKRKIESHIAENWLRSLKNVGVKGGVKWYIIAFAIAVVVVVALRMMGMI
jgi:hypothetical protein